MTLLGASLSIAGLAGCESSGAPSKRSSRTSTRPRRSSPASPATTPRRCRSAGAPTASSSSRHEGRPTKIEGNPAHPSTLGASSARIQASVLGLYDPDRSQTVRLKGEPKSWTDFVTAWAELSKAHAADGGAGLAVLSESFSSPTLARLATEFRARYPKATWATYEAVSDENRLAGLQVRHWARPRPHAADQSSVRHPRPRRRPAPDRPRDDPSRARLRGRKTRGSLGRRDEQALRC